MLINGITDVTIATTIEVGSNRFSRRCISLKAEKMVFIFFIPPRLPSLYNSSFEADTFCNMSL